MEAENKFKLFLPALEAESNNNITLISADIRREYTQFALFVTKNRKIIPKIESTYSTTDFPSFSEMVKQFIEDNSLTNIAKLAIGVPGPVISGRSEPQRLPWKLDANEIRRETQIDKVYMINDLEATAYALENFDDNTVLTLHESDDFSPGNVAVLAPGAGLGEAGLFWDGICLRPFATEGGHCEFSPRTADEVEFYHFLQKIYGIVSWESVLSNEGLFNIYRFLRDVKHQRQPEWLTQEIEAGNFSKAIINGALEGKDRICTMVIDTFMIFLAREANSLVLKMKATGGLVITGDLPIMLQKFLNKEKFYKNFIISDKMEAVLKDIPIYLVKDTNTIIKGAAVFAAFSEE
ncbi:glucokinase [Kaistella palustris]|uniref:glucokinase n=1 Tax=Kaistella palustris TaxID=493376 RepID=UPI000406DE67|nr:glucokinase [Kaistella palustris]